jgi:hypothetical protein
VIQGVGGGLLTGLERSAMVWVGWRGVGERPEKHRMWGTVWS